MTEKRVSDMTGDEIRDMAAARPVTYLDASAWSGSSTHKARERFDELTLRALLVSSEAKLRARGEWDESKHGAAGGQEALTVAEHLEVLATGEVLARYYRHPAFVHDAVKAGATWEQIAAARGTDEPTVRRQYREWAAGQHRYAGMGDAEYAAAIARASAGADGTPDGAR